MRNIRFSLFLATTNGRTHVGQDMKVISYSKDVDALLIELSKGAIAYAEDDFAVILSIGNDDKLLLIEILDFRRLMSEKTVSELIAAAA